MGSSEQTSTSSGLDVAMNAGQGIIGNAGDIYNQMMGSSVPQMGQIQINGNLQNAWDQMASGSLTDLAQNLGQAGAGMMAGMDQLGGLYEQIGAGPNTYNIQNMRDTLLGDQQANLDKQSALMNKQLEGAIAQSTGQIYGQAAGGGNVGSSRTQLATGQAAGSLAGQTASKQLELQNAAYNTAMNQSMSLEQQRLGALGKQAAGIMQQGQLGSQLMNKAGSAYQQSVANMLQAGTGEMSLNQQNAQIDYMNQMNNYNKPMQLLGWYNQMVSPWTGAQTTNTQSGGSNGLMQGIMGLGGSILGGPIGGAIAGSMFG